VKRDWQFGIIERIMKKLLEKYNKLLVFSCSRCRYLPSDNLTMILNHPS